MGNLKEIRQRIVSVKSTQQITKAMKMVSAAKFKKAQDAILKIRPYANKIKSVIEPLAKDMDDLSDNPYFKIRDEEKVLVISVTSDKGLCGSFNGNINKETHKLIDTLNAKEPKKSISLLCFGKKSYEYFSKRGFTIWNKFFDMSGNISFIQIEELAEKVLKSFELKEFDKIYFVYNAYKNPAVYISTTESFLPLEIDISQEKTKFDNHHSNFIFEPSEKVIIEELIPTSLKIKFYRILLESNAAEHGARMTAMENATENAEELLTELRLHYNKERQASITKEILEIVGGSSL